MQVFVKVIGAHDHTLQHRVRPDSGGIKHRTGCFHHCPERDVTHDFAEGIKIGGAFDLGEQYGVTIHLSSRLRILTPPFGIKSVDTNHLKATAITTLLQSTCQRVSRTGFFVRDHCILQIENDRIRGKTTRLIQRAFLGTGYVKNGTQRTGDFRHRTTLQEIMLRVGLHF